MFSAIKIYCIVLQVPNNVVSYVITGGDGNPLEYFFIHPSTGVIVLQKSVKSISTSNFRVWVFMSDSKLQLKVTIYCNLQFISSLHTGMLKICMGVIICLCF